MEGDTPIPIGRPWEHRMGAVAGELLRSRPSAFGRPEDFDRDRREPPILQEPLMGRGVVGLDEGLMALLELRRRAREGELIIIQPPLDVEMCLHEVLIALAFRALNRLMLNLQAATDGPKVVRRIGPATIGHEIPGRPITQTGRIEDHERHPGGSSTHHLFRLRLVMMARASSMRSATASQNFSRGIVSPTPGILGPMRKRVWSRHAR